MSDGSAESAYYAQLARTRGAAGAVQLDGAGRVLLVRPGYKPVWDLPGGVIEAEESPMTACVREVREELGFTPVLERLVGVVWFPPRPRRVASNLFVFAGRLPETARAAIEPDPGEIAEFGFFPVSDLPEVEPHTERRVRSCVEGYLGGETVYYEESTKPAWYGDSGEAKE
ncbi:NUDIX domain-containing protein [Amycolatopsis speibonae]|uniref:NUDIX domain-containing protein n=1 Tax=Amycolatopsis speibonae TaxID=1450224 RepID=A0ABV7P6U7_9PSEU